MKKIALLLSFLMLASALAAALFTVASADSFMLGDVNGNGKIDSKDYAMAKRHFLRTYVLNAEQINRGDVNRNGVIDSKDYAMIKRHFLGTYVIQQLSEGPEYTIDDNGKTVTITGIGTLSTPDLVIPDKIDGKYVTGIAEKAFEGNTDIKTVVIPDTVNNIGYGAFMDCENIEIITIPFVGESESATNEKAVFGYIFGYEEIEKDIDWSGDYKVLNEKPISIVGETWQFSYSKGHSQHTFYYYIPDTIKNVTVTKQTTVPAYAFNNCDFLEKIEYTATGGKKLAIGDSAFRDCESLADGIIKDGKLSIDSRFTSVGEYAFANCVNIKEITVNDSVTSIGFGAFMGCDELVDVTVPFVGESETAEHENAVFGYIFGYEYDKDDDPGYQGDYLIINEKPAKVPGETWQYSYHKGHDKRTYYYFIPETIKNVTITKQTAIPPYAFNGCDFIESIKYTATGGKKLVISEAAFQNCASLNGGVIENGVLTVDSRFTEIKDYAFAGCETITAITVNDTVRNIGFAAFYECDSLEMLTIPFVGASETAEHENAVFGYIFGYEYYKDDDPGYQGDYLIINEKPAKVPGETWQYSYHKGHDKRDYYYFIPETIKNVTVSKQTAIPAYAFNGCSMLEKITLKTGYSAGDNAFQDCTAEIITK